MQGYRSPFQAEVNGILVHGPFGQSAEKSGLVLVSAAKAPECTWAFAEGDPNHLGLTVSVGGWEGRFGFLAAPRQRASGSRAQGAFCARARPSLGIQESG